jgi:hypothetical protein
MVMVKMRDRKRENQIRRSVASAVVVGYTPILLLGHVPASVGGRIRRPEERRVRHGAAFEGRGKRQAECTHAHVVDDDTNQIRGQRADPHHMTFKFEHLDWV